MQGIVGSVFLPPFDLLECHCSRQRFLQALCGKQKLGDSLFYTSSDIQCKMYVVCIHCYFLYVFQVKLLSAFGIGIFIDDSVSVKFMLTDL